MCSYESRSTSSYRSSSVLLRLSTVEDMIGVNQRTSEAYWELSGPSPMLRNGASCRACRKPIYKGKDVYVREGRKLRFFYHVECFVGDADPRTQTGSTFEKKRIYHKPTAPNVSGLKKNLKVFQPKAPRSLGKGKWSVSSRGYKPSTNNSRTADRARTEKKRGKGDEERREDHR